MLISEMESVERFIAQKYPDAAVYLQDLPRNYVPNMFLVRVQGVSSESETAYHFRSDRDYQIVYIGADSPDVLSTMDALNTAFYQRQLIPVIDTLSYIRVNSFAFSQPFRTDDDLVACIGVLTTEVRQARDQVEYEKIMNVITRIK